MRGDKEMIVACCPGKTRIRSLKVGGQSVGVSQLDDILRAAKALDDQAEEAVKGFLIKQLKIYNYIPSGAEQEYLDAVWEEYVRFTKVDSEVKK